MESKSALLIGASGLVGGHCLLQLLEEPSYTQVIVLVRRPLPVIHEKLVQQISDFDELESLGKCPPVDDVYCCLGTTIKKSGTQEAFRKVDFDYPVKLAALTQHCGANQFLLISSMGANPHSRIFYNRVKGEVEEAIRKISFKAFHIFRPSLLLGKRVEHRPGEQVGAVAMTALKYAMIGPFRTYRAILAKDVAQAMVRVAQMDRTGVNIYDSQSIQKIADGADTRHQVE
ncbi:MAG: oxidoreductase [Ignavibacteriae bacterium]|nr:MAG: oxidoreductase [Ignavibacteriota bacterium]